MGADLAALVASPHFRRMPGMAGIDVNGDRWRLYHDGNHRHPRWANEYSLRMHAWEIRLDMRPDLTDPATIGCLEAMAAEAWGDPYLFTVHDTLSDGIRYWCVYTVGYGGGEPVTHAPSKGEALALAILRAHPPEVSDA